MSQYNSVHQHHDSAAAHTCFLTQGCKDEPLACFQLLQNVPRPIGALLWKTTCRSGGANLPMAGKLSQPRMVPKPQTQITKCNWSCSACYACVKYCPRKKIWLLYMWLLRPTACLFWVTLKSVAVSWHHPNQELACMNIVWVYWDHCGGTELKFIVLSPLLLQLKLLCPEINYPTLFHR